MIRNSSVKLMSLVASVCMTLAMANQALAVEGCTQSGTSLATTVVNLKGQYACSDIQGRSQVIGTLSTNADGSINWNSNGVRVTEVLVTGTAGGNTCEYVYSGGATSGNNLGYLKSNNAYQGVQGVALCTDGVPPPPSKTIPTCAALNLSGGIDGVQIQCPADPTKKSIIYNLEIGKPFFSENGSPIACVCNANALPECDPGKKAGEVGACVTTLGSKVGAEVTTHIEINNDPYTCTTRAGLRVCNCIDADIYTAGCQ